MREKKIYAGIDKEPHGGMTPTANIVRDARVFGIIPESESCAGWSVQDMQNLYDKVAQAWEPYGNLASNLPSDLRERHQRIYAAAVELARRQGWNPELSDDD